MNKLNINRERKMILILALIVVVVFASFAALKLKAQSAEAIQVDNSSPLRISSSPLEIEISVQGEDFTLVKNDGRWACKEKEPLSLAYPKIAFMVETLRSLEAERVLEYAKVKDGQCGFDEPSAVLDVKLEDGRKKYFIGAYNSVLEEYYVRVEGSENVFLVSADSVALLNRSLKQLVAAPDITDVGIGDIDTIDVQYNETIRLTRSDSGFSVEQDGEKFEVSEYRASQICSAINSAKYSCKEYETTPSLERLYGLKEPAAEISLGTANGETYVLKLSEASDGKHYAIQTGNDVIYQIDGDYYGEILSRLKFDR